MSLEYELSEDSFINTATTEQQKNAVINQLIRAVLNGGSGNGDLAALEGRVGTLENQVDSLDGRVDALESAAGGDDDEGGGG